MEDTKYSRVRPKGSLAPPTTLSELHSAEPGKKEYWETNRVDEEKKKKIPKVRDESSSSQRTSLKANFGNLSSLISDYYCFTTKEKKRHDQRIKTSSSYHHHQMRRILDRRGGGCWI